MVSAETTAADLIAAAGEHGYEVSARSLELWRYRGLLPRGRRAPTGRAVWRYPPETESQLLRLLHWRERTRSLDLIRLALWVEGFAIDLDGVRTSLLAFVDSWARALARDLGGGQDISATIDRLARKAARMRGRRAIPRKVRMTADERTRACAYALAFMLGAEEEVARRSDDAILLERMLGLRSGRGGGMAGVMPLEENMLRLARLPSPDSLRALLQDAQPQEFELVRRIAQMIVVWLPLFLPVFLEQFGARAVALVDVAGQLFEDMRPEYYAFSVLALLVSLHAKAHAVEDLRGHLDQLTPAAINHELLGILPDAQRRDAIRTLAAHPGGEAARGPLPGREA